MAYLVGWMAYLVGIWVHIKISDLIAEFFHNLCSIRSPFNLITVLEKQWRDLISDFALISKQRDFVA